MKVMQGHNRKIFLRGQSHFSWFSSWREMLFPNRKFHFGKPKTNFSRFEKWKAKKKKKKRSSPHFVRFPPSIVNFLPPFILQFSFFSSLVSHFPLFPFFPLPLFSPVGQQKFPGQKSLGVICPHLLRHWGDGDNNDYDISNNKKDVMMVMQQQQLWQWSIDRDDEDTTPKLVPVLV